jgi:hypothetical protein
MNLLVFREGGLKENVELENDMAAYLEGAYANVASAWKRRKSVPFPLFRHDLEQFVVYEVAAKSRGLFCHVEVDLIVGTNSPHHYGVGYAKCSFDAFRLNRGVSLALSRALEDILLTIAIERKRPAMKEELAPVCI